MNSHCIRQILSVAPCPQGSLEKVHLHAVKRTEQKQEMKVVRSILASLQIRQTAFACIGNLIKSILEHDAEINNNWLVVT